MFTKQHYKAIAEIIKHDIEYWQSSHEVGATTVAVKLADYFAKDNSKFNKDKFLKSCGIADN